MFIKVIDDILDAEIADKIEENILKNDKFVWFFEPAALADDSGVNYNKTPFFVHPLLADGHQSGQFWMADALVRQIMPHVGAIRLHSSNVNLLPEHPILGLEQADGHVDRKYDEDVYDDFDTYTAVYYVNDAENVTIMYNETFDSKVGLYNGPFTERLVVPSKKNSLLVFDSRIYHSAPAASLKGVRSVINFNFMVPRESSVVN
jgi:hypothetical protein